MEIIMSRKKQFKNKDLKAATARIRKAGEAVRVNVYRIATELAKIHNKKLWVEDGYDDIADYALKVLHIKKTMCYDLIGIGNTFVGRTGCSSNLTRPDGCKEDYCLGQLRVMLPIGYDKSEELAKDGIIDPSMSVRKIKSIVRFNNSDGSEQIADELELTSELPEPPEPVITIADGEIFFTQMFSMLKKEQLRNIWVRCNLLLTEPQETED